MYTIKTENLIVGGGAAGLALARYLGKDTMILSENFGGLLRSFKFGNFTFDYGGHVYTAKDPEVVALMKEANGTFFEERKAYYLAQRSIDKVKVPFPVQSSGYFDIEPIPLPREPSTLYEWSKWNFGEKFYNDFFKPFNTRVWGTDPRNMSCDWIENRVAPADAPKDWGINSSFWYAPGSQLLDALYHQSEVYLLSGTLKNLDKDRKKVTFSRPNLFAHSFEGPAEGVIEYKKVFMTIPFLSTRKSNGMLALGIGLKKKVDYDFHWVYPHVDSKVHRVTLLSRYHPSLAPLDKDSLLLEIPAQNLQNSFPLTEDLHELARQFLIDAGFYPIEDQIESVWYHFEKHSMPVQTHGLRPIVGLIKSYLAKRDIYLAGRWGSHGYWNLQDIFKDAEVTANYARTKEERYFNDYFDSEFYYK